MAIFSWFRKILNGTATVLFRCVLHCFRLVFFMGPSHKQINPPMPSSSSSFHSTPPSTSSSSSSDQSWKHDVFLSFRGTDVRNNFVDHLYSVLVQQGIYTYKDDQTLPRGETIAPSLFKAIEESRIAVIVFSENYADSSWCLQELEHIMKCKDERSLIVMPIFYHIEPSELRKQIGKYGAALAKHESENKNIKSWRKALEDAGNLSGDVPNGPETNFIKKIVDTISNRLCAAISSDNEHLIGIEARVQELKQKLAIDSHGVVMVGIWGLGGGGKTTLASSVYDEIKTMFDGYCFIENVREESSKSDGLPKLQEKILSLVLKQKQMEVSRVTEGKSLIKHRLRRKKVLIVLDDVHHIDQLEALAGSHDWFGEGSRIIITTRDEHVLRAHKVKIVIHNISLLNDDEAIQLFFKHAVGRVSVIEDHEMLSKDVVSYAGGLPLAVKVLGSFLCDKKEREWKSALARLKDIPESDIVERLKISYDGLKFEEKELFLDIVCFFRGKKKDEAMEILDGCGFHPDIGVKVLIQKTLITVSEEGRFQMHDLIEEMGHYIVRGENPKTPEKHSRIWLEEDILNICAMDSMMENFATEALYFPRRGGFPRDNLTELLVKMKNLPEVLPNMKNLRLISLDGYAATSLPRNFQTRKLCYLGLKNSLVEQLWEGYKHLPNLKVLDLSFSVKLVRTPDFSGLPYLERMILKGCRNLKEICSSIGDLERLIFLDIGWCRSLEVFPPITRMKKLETFILTWCTQLRKFPDIQGNMDNLVELNLGISGIEVVPSSIGRYCTNLVTLDLSHCKHLQSIEGNFCCLQHLEKIYLHGSDQLKIPAEGLFDVKCCLHVLSLSETSSLKKFRQGMVSMKLFGFSTSLRRLKLSRCKLEDGDMSSVLFQELSNLQVLDLSGNNFSQLHSSLLQLPHLKFLNLSYCENLVELPDLPSSIAILIAEECDLLDIVGDFPTNHLKWLWKVSLSTDTRGRIDGKRVVESMLQGNAVQDYFISLYSNKFNISTRDFVSKTCMLELPSNWRNEFSGFLIYAAECGEVSDAIIIDDVLEVSDDETTDEAEESNDETTDEDEESNDETTDEDEESNFVCKMGYISFASLMHTTWLNSPHTKISFSIEDFELKVELVPRRSKGGSIERPKDATNSSGFWDEESKDKKTFEIKYDLKSSIRIEWCHAIYRGNMF